MLDLENWQGAYGEHLVQLIVTSAGYACHKPADLGYGIDLVVSRSENPAGMRRPPNLEQQVKTIRSPIFAPGYLLYDLEVGLYDRLRSEGDTRRYLVLVVVPGEEPDTWHEHPARHSVFRERAYYVDLLGAEKTTNTTTIRVRASLDDRLVPETVRSMMASIEQATRELTNTGGSR